MSGRPPERMTWTRFEARAGEVWAQFLAVCRQEFRGESTPLIAEGDSPHPHRQRLERRARRQLARRTAHRRARLVAIGLCLGYGILALRAAQVMLGPDERLQTRARVQFQQPVVIQAQRGEILDRDGHLLASSVLMPTLHADPSRIEDDEVTSLSSELAGILDQSPSRLSRRLARENRRDVWLARNLHPALAREALAKSPRPGALWITEEYRRYYPGGSLASALLGIVGRNGRGQAGLERAWDRYLRGDTFKFVELRDRRGRGIRPVASAFRTAHRGDSVTLTLDRILQLAAEQALDEVVERSAPLSANMVVMDPRTGEILAMANRPTTNPNDTWNLDIRDLKNHAVVDAVEPGSVFKPFVAALALEDGLVTPESTVDCENGAWRVGRNTITDTHAHEHLSIGEIIKFSSNIGAAKLALRLGPEVFLEGLRSFGYGRSVSLGLLGEIRGTVRSPDHVRTIELATTAYGQGVTASTLQLATAVSAVANGGLYVKPYVVREVRDRRGEVVYTREPEVDHRVIAEEHARAVARMMVGVTETGGTATRAAMEGYRVAGKTGTAWKVVDGKYSPTARVASFIGFLPADDPVVAMAVIVDTPTQGSSYGGLAAAPAFRRVAEAVVRHYGLPPDPDYPPRENDESTTASREEAPVESPPLYTGTGFWSRPRPEHSLPRVAWSDDGRYRLPDLSGLSLRDALVSLQGTGLEVALYGHGRVVGQRPPAGELLAPGRRLEVVLR